MPDQEIVVDPPTFTIDPPPFGVIVPSAPPMDISEVQLLLVAQRHALTARVSEIESLLGFITTADDLAVRVARLENFVLGR
jgi:hypothetical protein